MNTPVALIIFNRPDCTARVLEAIAEAKPGKLFVIADGPREGHPTDVENCRAAREMVDRIDWECEVRTDYSEVNLGCKYRPESGIQWVLDQVEEAIILEDDCLPDPSFFRFCEELLERYRHDERVMMIGGFNFFGRTDAPGQSYHYSYLGATWGWATWRRAWQLNDPELRRWPMAVEGRLIESLFPDPVHTRFWHDVFARLLDGRLPDAWDYQWQLACWMNSGFRIIPERSLVSNIGFREDATHTFGENPFLNEAQQLPFPLKHPECVGRDYELDRRICEALCVLEGYRITPPPRQSLLTRAIRKVARELRAGS
ncbi:MAG: glycosyltransferase family 2 protein [Blastocatellia bacterium]|nr:glycosyltransferase family 2 protein [Blastocatellia bacterium]